MDFQLLGSSNTRAVELVLSPRFLIFSGREGNGQALRPAGAAGSLSDSAIITCVHVHVAVQNVFQS